MEIDEEVSRLQIEHPLTNDLVLQELVKYIRPRDIPRCRQVCRKWNQYLLPRMRSEVQLKCLNQASFGKATSLLAKFLSVMESSHDIPFGNYMLLNLNLRDHLVEKFFLVCGVHVHTLRVQFTHNDIDICSLRELLLMRAPAVVTFSVEGLGLPENVTNHPSLFPQWSGYYLHCQGAPTLPFLESIQFKTEEGQKCHPGFLFDLFKATVNLKHLKFLKYSDPTYSLTILSALFDSNNYRRLNCLHLERLCEGALRMMVIMSEDGMKLKQFSFQSLAEDVRNDSLEQLISMHKDTLQVLSLNEVMGTRNLHIRLPPMTRLRKLTRSAICSSQIKFGPICFATHVPNLDELSVYAFADELDWNDYFSETVNWIPCMSLRKLELPINLRDPIRLQKLAKLFPSVTSVIVSSPADEIIPLLWEVWPEMEELHLSLTDGNANVDSLFTGIPSQECVAISAAKAYAEVDIERIRTGPSIAYLRGLKKLNLDITPKDIFSSFCFQNTTCLPSDIAGYFGLAYLSNLEDLVITSSQITPECALFISSKFQKFAKVKICDPENLPVIVATRPF